MSRYHTIRAFAYCAVIATWASPSGSAGQLVPSDIVSRFDESEIESIDANITIALDTVPDLGSRTWISSRNQANGTIKILRSFEFDSSVCREIQIVSRQVGFTDQRTISFCQGDDFYWHPLTYKFRVRQ